MCGCHIGLCHVAMTIIERWITMDLYNATNKVHITVPLSTTDILVQVKDNIVMMCWWHKRAVSRHTFVGDDDGCIPVPGSSGSGTERLAVVMFDWRRILFFFHVSSFQLPAYRDRTFRGSQRISQLKRVKGYREVTLFT